MLRDLLLDRVGEKGRDGRPGAGQDADEEAQHRAAGDGPAAARPVARARHHVAQAVAAVRNRRALGLFGAGQHLAQPEQADRDRQEVDPVHHLGNAEREARLAGDDVEADHRQHQAEQHADVALDRALAGEQGHRGQADEHQGEGLGRAERERPARQQRRDQHQQDDAEGAGDERADRGDAERRPGAPLQRHLVAVDAGHHRGRFAGRVDQHRGDGAAVHRAGVEGGEHDDSGGRLHAEGERQQQRHPGRRPHPGQRADQDAHDDAADRHEQVERRQRDREAEREVRGEVHRSGRVRTRTGRPASAPAASR